MSIHALITGTLHKPAEVRTSKSGNEFATARLRADSEDRDGAATTVWVSVIAFSSEAVATMQRLNPGDAVSVGGKAKLVMWTKEDKSGVGLDVVADTVSAARPKPRERREVDGAHRATNSYPPPAQDRPFDDDIMF